MTTPIENFHIKDCNLIDPLSVNAYIDLALDPDNPTGIILDTSWGTVKLDLKSIVKTGETITTLELLSDGLCYHKEDGTTDYISGDDLSRIISMQLLKDVDQDKPIAGGNVYMFNSTTNLFEPFDLQKFVDDTNHAIQVINQTLVQHGNRISDLETRMTNVENRISDIESLIYNYPADKTTKIPRANVNFYGDITNTNSHAHGIFCHDPNVNITDDTYFA